jgi:hypothetical protein
MGARRVADDRVNGELQLMRQTGIVSSVAERRSARENCARREDMPRQAEHRGALPPEELDPGSMGLNSEIVVLPLRWSDFILFGRKRQAYRAVLT